MKRIGLWILVFVAGGALAILNDFTLANAWIHLWWREPVSDWLLSVGFPRRLAVGYWSLVWVCLPDIVLALLSGTVIGRLAKPGAWWRYALVFGLGFIVPGYWVKIPYFLSLLNQIPWLAYGTLWSILAWDLATVLLFLLTAWLFRRRKPRESAACDGVTDPVPGSA